MRVLPTYRGTTATLALMTAIAVAPHLASAQTAAPQPAEPPMQGTEATPAPIPDMQAQPAPMPEGAPSAQAPEAGAGSDMQAAEPAAPDAAAAEASADAGQPTEQMQAVLDKLAELGAQPVSTLEVEAARTQPTPADAVMAVMEDQGIEADPALAAIQTEDITIPGPAGDIEARVYTPEGDGPFPVVVYYHGGGWVIADIDTYDASPRALAAGAQAIVVAAHYRQAPEDQFPAAHEDAYAAYEWVVENAHEFNGDAARVAVAGESAGGNLAANVAIMAAQNQATVPVHQLLVYPVAGNDMETESYVENADAAPLGKADMEWFVEHVFASMDETSDDRINLVGRTDLGEIEGLAPATVITAQIDPLRSEGQAYAELLQEAGVEVEAQNYDSVTHEFFGMGAVVDEAKEAVDLATANLREAFGEVATGSTTQPMDGMAAPEGQSGAMPAEPQSGAPAEPMQAPAQPQ